MRLTAVHVRYWHARTSPRWAQGIAGKPIVSIHECVNAHAPERPPVHPDVTRLCGVLQGAPKDAIRGELVRLADTPHQTRYYATAKKWLKRLRDADALAWWQGRAGLTGAALAAYDSAPLPPFVAGHRQAWQTPTGRLAFRNAEFHNMKPRPYQLAVLDNLLSTDAPEPINRQMAFYSYAWASRKD